MQLPTLKEHSHMNPKSVYLRSALSVLALWMMGSFATQAQEIISRPPPGRPDPSTLPRGPVGPAPDLEAMQRMSEISRNAPTVTPPAPLPASEVVIPTTPAMAPAITDRVRKPDPIKDSPITANAKP